MMLPAAPTILQSAAACPPAGGKTDPPILPFFHSLPLLTLLSLLAPLPRPQWVIKTHFDYDDNHNLTHLVANDGMQIDYRYDVLDRMIAIDPPATLYDVDLSYTDGGELEQIVYQGEVTGFTKPDAQTGTGRRGHGRGDPLSVKGGMYRPLRVQHNKLSNMEPK